MKYHRDILISARDDSTYTLYDANFSVWRLDSGWRVITYVDSERFTKDFWQHNKDRFLSDSSIDQLQIIKHSDTGQVVQFDIDIGNGTPVGYST